MNDIQIFNFNSHNVRTTLINGKPYFLANDVAENLGYQNISDAILRHCKGVVKYDIVDKNVNRPFTFIPESDVYRLVMRSKLPEAEKFQDWVVEEVLPSIRRTGSYSVPKSFGEALKLAYEQQVKIEEQNLLIEQAKPKIEFYDAVTQSDQTIEMGEAAKVLNLGIGRNKLFEVLRRKGILMSNNVPYQEFITRGFFRIVESKYHQPDGSPYVNLKTVVYQKGLDFIRRLIINNMSHPLM